MSLVCEGESKESNRLGLGLCGTGVLLPCLTCPLGYTRLQSVRYGSKRLLFLINIY